jgi:hypothetical protein
MIKYLRNNLIALDQLINAVSFGDPDETVSSRVGKAIRRAKTPRKWTIAYWLNLVLDKIELNHCLNNIEEDEGKDNII